MINHRRLVSQLREIVLGPAFNRILGWFIDGFHLGTSESLPNYFENPYTYLNPTWIWPEWEEIDPLKAAKALVLEVESHITSLEEVSNGRGKTLDQHLDGVQRSQQAKQSRGIENAASSTDDDELPDDDDD